MSTPITPTIKRLIAWIKNQPVGPKQILMTPELAYGLLAYNSEDGVGGGWFHTHPHRRAVAALVHMMRGGDWVVTHGLPQDPIKIDRDGRVLDGQARLHAAIEAGMPVDMWIEFGHDDRRER